VGNIKSVEEQLKNKPKTWLVTGAAGFIGSNLVQRLLELNQTVIGLDNFSNGYKTNLTELLANLNPEQAHRFTFIEGDIRALDICRLACEKAEIVLHQAALGSVPRSIEDPIATNQSNIDGTLNMLVAARDNGIKRFITASSSSVYGDDSNLPKVEKRVGIPMSPYAVSKYAAELYTRVFAATYDMECIALRYFNVFGPRQNPDNPYAAVISKWFGGLLKGEPIVIYGDGETSRDFSYVENAIQANILAAVTENKEALGKVYNVACSQNITLNQLFKTIRGIVARSKPDVGKIEPIYCDFRAGDVRHSLADISKARSLLGYEPTHSAVMGLEEASNWYLKYFQA
jgi:UDP-N-acetylglucosamine 4-epimerase